MSIVIGIGIRPVSTPSVPWDSDTLNYISGLATPLSTPLLTKIDTLIRDIKTGLGITHLYDFFDTFYVLANETAEAACRNLVKRAHDITPQGSPTFAALEGYTGTTSKWLDTNYNPATQGVNFTLNNAGFAIYFRTNPGTYAVGGFSGCINAAGHGLMLNSLRTANTGSYNLNNTTNLNSPFTGNIGMWSAFRTASNYSIVYRNKIATMDSVVASIGIPSRNIYLLAGNLDGVAGNWLPSQHSIAYTSKSMVVGQNGVVVDAIEKYMDANGKGIIP